MAPSPSGPLYLVAVDGSALSERVLAHAFALASATGARLRVVTVEDIGLLRAEAIANAGMAVFTPGTEETARLALDDARDQARRAGAPADFATITLADPAPAIVKEATARGASLIIVGSHGRTGIARALLGSVAEHVVRHAHCPVLVVRQ